MTRIKRGTNKRRRHKKLLKATKGHQGVRHTLYRRAHESLIHALAYSYAHRKEKKGDMRKLWNIRINAAARANGTTYSRLIHGLKLAGVSRLTARCLPTSPSATRKRSQKSRSRRKAQLEPAA